MMRQGAELAAARAYAAHARIGNRRGGAVLQELLGMGPTTTSSRPLLAKDVWMAHCVHMNDSDIAASPYEDGCRPLPVSNARLAAGIARVPDMLAAGVPSASASTHGVEPSRVSCTPSCATRS